MKDIRRGFLGLLLAAFAASAFHASAADSPREHLSLDTNWKFYLGDGWPFALNLAKAAASTGPASERFSDAAWRTLDLPHDWAIELPFDPTADTSHGFKPVGPGFPKNSVGWYRRSFALPREDSGKRISLAFDGVFRDATVWVNGWLVKRHEGGYYPFREDITDIVKFGGDNVIAVRVDASESEGWFYEGAGIYRHVWLDKTAPIHFGPDSTVVTTPEIGADCSTVHVEAALINDSSAPKKVSVMATVYGPPGSAPDGSYACAGESPAVLIAPRSSANVAFDVKIPWKTRLWSPEQPDLHSARVSLREAAETLDEERVSFGVRTVAFDKDRGFLLNGQPYVIKGTCNHQDHAGVGAALPDALQAFRIAKLKEFGCNAYRCSHNPPTPELLDACDRLGMIVMDECRLLGSDSENLDKLATLVRRDRNHPSVAMWCVANEEHAAQATEAGGRVGATMQRVIKGLDLTRPVTAAEVIGNVFGGLMGNLEVRGWNYWVGKSMDQYHADHPDQPNVGTEQGSTVSTRGIYENDKGRGYVSAYDVNFPSWATTAERWWSYFADRPWLSGGFVWTGFDYRGEPTPYAWPCINSHFGILDTCGFPKDNFYYYQAWWTPQVVLHLLPHWNWPGKEGQTVRVDALSNCEEVELFLNGESLGKQPMKRNSKLTWSVKYAPGTLSAKGYNGGKLVAEQKTETTGETVALQLTADRTSIQADGEDVSVFTVSATDAQGRGVPVAQDKVNFALEGAGKILGVGNGDPSSHEPDTFVPNAPVRTVPVVGWRWQRVAFPTRRGDPAPELAPEFDDSAWNVIKPKTDGETGDQVLQPGETAIYRAHVTLSENDLRNPGVQIRFAGCDDRGWYYVNNQRVGESHDWQAQPLFSIKGQLHAGDNVIAVGVKNEGGTGGLNPDVNVELVGDPAVSPWSRRLFNGLAQVIVQSSKHAGEIKLSASAEGLQGATTVVATKPGAGRPAVP